MGNACRKTDAAQLVADPPSPQILSDEDDCVIEDFIFADSEASNKMLETLRSHVAQYQDGSDQMFAKRKQIVLDHLTIQKYQALKEHYKTECPGAGQLQTCARLINDVEKLKSKKTTDEFDAYEFMRHYFNFIIHANLCKLAKYSADLQEYMREKQNDEFQYIEFEAISQHDDTANRDKFFISLYSNLVSSQFADNVLALEKLHNLLNFTVPTITQITFNGQTLKATPYLKDDTFQIVRLDWPTGGEERHEAHFLGLLAKEDKIIVEWKTVNVETDLGNSAFAYTMAYVDGTETDDVSYQKIQAIMQPGARTKAVPQMQTTQQEIIQNAFGNDVIDEPNSEEMQEPLDVQPQSGLVDELN